MTRRGDSIPLLKPLAITTALAGVAQAAVNENGYESLVAPSSVMLQATFVYGSGGTSAKAYVQTTLDNGATWIDVACFAFTTASAIKVSTVSTLIAPPSQAFAPSDGALADNTVSQGVLGLSWRVKLTTVGTYAATTIAVAMIARG